MDIKNGIEKRGKFSTNPKDLSLLVLYAIVFPIVKKILRKKTLGGILYFVVSKVVNKAFSRIEIQNNIESENNEVDKQDSNTNRFFAVSEKVKNVSKAALKSLIVILKIIGIAVIAFGAILLLILFLIFYFYKASTM